MANGQNNQKRLAAAGTKAKKKKKSKIILLVLELMVVAVLVAALWVLKDFGTSEGPQLNVEISEKDLEINTPVQENEVMKGYRNIALFGVDSRSGALTKGTLSDCIIIASINQDTGDVKLVSVYRDTYLNLGNDKYNKCNGAYSHGGAEQALKMLNMNLDMDIKEFVTIGFEGLTAAVDALGGVYLDGRRGIEAYQQLSEMYGGGSEGGMGACGEHRLSAFERPAGNRILPYPLQKGQRLCKSRFPA